MMDESINPIRRDYLSGMTYVEIGEKYGIDPRTAKRYALNNLPTEHLYQRPFVSVLDEFKPLISKWLEGGKIPSTVIHDRLIELGCNCGYTIVNDYVQKVNDEYERASDNKDYTESRNWNKKYKQGLYKKHQLQKGAIERIRNINK